MKPFTKLGVCLLVLFLSVSFPTMVSGQYDQKFHKKSQKPSGAQLIGDDVNPQGGTMAVKEYENMQAFGSMYLTEEWQKGQLILSNGTEITSGEYRYNIYAQQMQFILDGDTMAFGKPDEIDLLRIGDKTFIFSSYQNCEGAIDSGYFEALHQAKCKLLKRYSITHHYLVEGKDSDKSFVHTTEYFLQRPGATACRLDCRKRHICESFCNYSDEMRSYIRKNKLHPEQMDDLLLIIAHYEDLLAGGD